MGRTKGELNTVCATCDELFHKPPSLQVIRCPECRTGMQRVGREPPKQTRVCPTCDGGRKAYNSQTCRKCYLKRVEVVVVPKRRKVKRKSRRQRA